MPPAAGLRQPSLRIALIRTTPDRTDQLGVIGLRCRVELYVEHGFGGVRKPLQFVVDSGASYSIISLRRAESEGIPVPPPETRTDIRLTTASGPATVSVRPGRLRAWWTAEQTGYPFDWPVLFNDDAPADVPPVLGLGGVIKTCRWTFDGSYAVDSPHGTLTLDDIR